MSLNGKGFMIWKVRDCEGGNPGLISSEAHAAGFTYVLIKIADGARPYNIDDGVDKVPAVVQALKSRGIKTWGWHYVYGDDPIGEAQIAISRIQQLGLDGYAIDAESEYKLPGRYDNAELFMSELRNSLQQFPIGLSSFRFPTLHPQLPWKAFLEKCDYNMPQVYWVGAHNPEAQLQRCVNEFQAMTPFRPIIPTGPVYRYGDWEPTPSDIIVFLNTARSLNLNAANFFTWDYRTILSSLWDAVASYPWGSQPPPQELPQQYFYVLNTHDPSQVSALYRSNAVHITAAQTIQGINTIENWYQDLLTNKLPDAVFTMTGSSGTGNSRHFTWNATSPSGQVKNGSDTIGILNGKIIYHYSFYKIT